jgi:hypothetical protein
MAKTTGYKVSTLIAINKEMENLREVTKNLLNLSEETGKTAKHSFWAAISCAVFAFLSLIISIITLVRCN